MGVINPKLRVVCHSLCWGRKGIHVKRGLHGLLIFSNFLFLKPSGNLQIFTILFLFFTLDIYFYILDAVFHSKFYKQKELYRRKPWIKMWNKYIKQLLYVQYIHILPSSLLFSSLPMPPPPHLSVSLGTAPTHTWIHFKHIRMSVYFQWSWEWRTQGKQN